MDERKLSEKEALEIIARVFDRNMRRMSFMRGELFMAWGVLLTLSALAEYGLYRWTGSRNVLWSWMVPLICGYIWTVYNTRRQQTVHTGFDDLLMLIWGLPFAVAVAAFVYALTAPENTINPVGITQLMLSMAVAITSEFFRGKGSQQSGSFVGLNMLGIFGIITSFTITFRMPFDPASGDWMLYVAVFGVALLVLPGLILRHITRRQCSKS